MSVSQSPDFRPTLATAPVRSGVSESGSAETERRERASLRRLEAGEQRKRAARLADALRQDSFVRRYVPRLCLAPAAERFVGADLWLGLPNRRRGLMPVAPLLRGIDRSMLRHDILSYTLRAVATELAAGPPRWHVGVPLPGATLGDGYTASLVRQAFEPLGVDLQRLDILIDEADLVIGGEHLQQQIASLRDAGIGVILEGFGHDFGGLALLSRLPFSGLKFDRRLVRALVADPAGPDVVLIRAAIDIARRFDVTVLLDGVETETELQKARELGVAEVQGPWIGPAMAAEMLRARLPADS
ncbi:MULTISPECIES: EAL domain-containing protein [unclassified Acidiphilium]|uniref:EAL domain-containing protein n=1 Tax=unclassified Acidiphilium TaxID=2617493 RepID=UPI00157B8A24|nr:MULTISPECIES: EAL domain-containing protein [unclassified Acidiphilium]HQT60411.1 EAL domain-containing protein [Acidiphilium sp.]